MSDQNTTNAIETAAKENNDIQTKTSFERRRTRQFYSFLKTVYSIANLAGFHIEGRIKVKDTKTGKVWE